MFRPNQNHRRTVRYTGEHSDYNEVEVRVLKDRGEDDEGHKWEIALPMSNRTVTVYDDELKPTPDESEFLDEKLERLMTGYHPLLRAFISEALIKYAEQCIADEAALIEEMRRGLISGEAWIECAKTTVAVLRDGQ